MISLLKKILVLIGIDPASLYRKIFSWSIRSALSEQKLNKRCTELRNIVPDLRAQYTLGFDEDSYKNYYELKMRGMHAFQVDACIESIMYVYDRLERPLTIVDVGDSSGTHMKYIKSICSSDKLERCLSVNLDPIAVDKINKGGGEAVLCKAEELGSKDVMPDLYLSFEMLEHLTDPLRFLHDIAINGNTDNFLISVPYKKYSQFGGTHIRLREEVVPDEMTPEDVHIYEFSTEDWLLLAKFAGWKPIFTRVYWQYPRKNIARVTQPLWKKFDYEGFFVMFLERDLSLSKHYTGW